MSVERFHIQVPTEMLDDLRLRLEQVRWPTPLENVDWERGTDMTYLRSLVSYWLHEYDWRKQEEEWNRFSQFQSTIDGNTIHFIREGGKGPNPLPIILTHGWPDSFIRYQKLIPLLTDPAQYGGDPHDSFDVIIPSLPGFGFSGPPSHSGRNNSRIADLWASLMSEELSYDKFVAAGGDMGSGVSRYLAFQHPELLFGIHLTDIGIIRDLVSSSDETLLSEEELQYKKEAQKWMAQEGGYLSIQSTKPQTLAYALSDSPVGLAGWIIEKFRSWSGGEVNLHKNFSMDELITNIMLYWVTNTISSSCNAYYENMHSLPPLGHIDVPTGVALFSSDVMLPPKKWALRNLNITRWSKLPRGGHFGAMEEPALLAEEIRAFCRPFRKKI